MELAQLLHNEMKRSKLTFQGGILFSWHNGFNFDFGKERIDVQQEVKVVDLPDCWLLDLQVGNHEIMLTLHIERLLANSGQIKVNRHPGL